MIHSVEMVLPNKQERVEYLFTSYGANITKYEHIGAAVRQLNRELKKEYRAFTISWLSCNASGTWNLHLKIDLIKLLGKSFIQEDDYDLVEFKIRDFLIDHFAESSSFDSHRLTRIDYKLDVRLPDKKQRELLFHLLEKHAAKYAYKVKIKWGRDEDGNPLKYQTSQYHKCKSVEFIIYSKEDERLAKGEHIESYEKNVIRYEVRLKNPHLNGMKRKDKGKSREKVLKTYFSKELWKEYMEKQVLPIVYRGDYYTITEAEKIIERSHYSKKKKDSLRSFLVSISKGSIDTPKKKGMSNPTHRKYIRELEAIGISPILIPKNRKDFPNSMKNPFCI
ncbi:phage/plasmid replication domain-containing protein [Evansella tamaricis]|uniref:Replication-associated protein G2P N-terminal domain-containing protein n=1 Tax=Evansella tamaricis TaxID=2069301 RepID=A0ABS6JBU6_9BACI|nr:phage/plasmid replication protein [Evansella tamaricis]MBU9710895.1 hypothetical protein [Evansella tamaricis]